VRRKEERIYDGKKERLRVKVGRNEGRLEERGKRKEARKVVKVGTQESR
jgi:hypothetical protein